MRQSLPKRPPSNTEFFRRAQLPRVTRGSVVPRRVLAWVAVLAFIAIAGAGAIYLGRPRESRVPAGGGVERVELRVVEEQPGSAEVEVQRDGEKRRVRVEKVGEDVVIQEVTPPEPPKRPWWQFWR